MKAPLIDTGNKLLDAVPSDHTPKGKHDRFLPVSSPDNGSSSHQSTSSRKREKEKSQHQKLTVDNIEVVRDLGYSHHNVWMVSLLIFVLDIIINLDHGAMPAALTQIQNDLDLKNTEMGGLGSMVFFGIVIGSACGAFIFKKYDYRTIIWISLSVNGVFLYLFTKFTPFYQLGLTRLTAGFAQVFIIIYKPVYVDTFAS